MSPFSKIFWRRLGAFRRPPWLFGAAGVTLTVGVGLVAVSVITGGTDMPLQHDARAVASAVASGSDLHRETRVLENGQWLESVKSGRFFREQRRRRSASRGLDFSRRSRLGALDPNARGPASPVTSPRQGSSTGTFRTVCVRLCDGYYYPISPSTTRGRFARDARACSASCSAPTRLYYQPAAGDSSEMVDRRGRKYIDLRTAYLYRTSYNPNCKCRPDAWEQEAQDQHRIYALQEQRREIRGRSKEQREERRELNRQIAELRGSIDEATRETRTEQRNQTRSAMASISKSEARDRVEQFVTETER